MSRVFSSDIILIGAGVLLLAGLFIVSQSGDFTLWVAAKIFYGFGVILFIFNR